MVAAAAAAAAAEGMAWEVFGAAEATPGAVVVTARSAHNLLHTKGLHRVGY